MIKIEIDAASGAEARAELLKLLGLSASTVTVSGKDLETSLERKDLETSLERKDPVKVETPAPDAEEPTRKRRTKAEIEAEKKAQTENPVATNEDETQTTDEIKYPELGDLQRACAIIVRAGYKQQGIDLVKNIGLAETSKDVLPENRQAVIDAITKFAEENKIAM